MFSAMIVSACDERRGRRFGCHRAFHRRAHVGRKIGRRPDDQVEHAVQKPWEHRGSIMIGSFHASHRARSAGRARRSCRCVLWNPDAARGRKLSDQRSSRAGRARHRHRSSSRKRRPPPTWRAGELPAEIGRAIMHAADEVLAGELRDQFIVDVYQAGAGTSHNMNANEVLANRAAEMLGRTRARIRKVHPNDHVNMSQSTNDVFPTSTRLALLLDHAPLVESARGALRLRSKQRRASFRRDEGRPNASSGRGADHAGRGVRRLRGLHPARRRRPRNGGRPADRVEPGCDSRRYRTQRQQRLCGRGNRLSAVVHRTPAAPGKQFVPRDAKHGRRRGVFRRHAPAVDRARQGRKRSSPAQHGTARRPVAKSACPRSSRARRSCPAK